MDLEVGYVLVDPKVWLASQEPNEALFGGNLPSPLVGLNNWEIPVGLRLPPYFIPSQSP